MIGRLATDFAAGIRLATARIKSRVMYTLISVIGIAIAVTCVAGTMIFLDNVSAGILALSFDESGADALDVQLRGRLRPFAADAHASLVEQVHTESALALGEAAGPVHRGFRAPTFVPSIVDTSDPLDYRRTFFGSVNGLTDQIDVTDGIWPPTQALSGTGKIEVLVERSVAWQHGLDLGSEFNYMPPGGSVEILPVRVAALFDRSDATSSFWRVVDEGFDVSGSSFELFPLFVVAGDFPALAEISRVGGEASYFWLSTVKSDRINASQASELVEQLDALATRLSGRLSGFQILTATDDAVAAFTRQNSIAAIPMKTIMLAISGIALILVLLVGSHTVDLSGSDDATISARGASRRQRLASTMAEALGVAITGTTIGLAVGIFIMGPIGVATAVGDLNFGIQKPQTWTVLASVFVGMAGAAMFAASTVSAASLLITRLYRNKSNQSGGPFFTRYYLDLVLAAIAVLLAWQISSGGIQLAENAIGEGQASQLSLALPAIAVVGLGAVGFRVLPLVFAVLAAVVSRMPAAIGKSAVAELGLKSLARRTTHQAKLVVMIAATTATAILLSSFESTIAASNMDQSAYRVGADVRATGLTYRSQWRIDKALGEMPEIDGVESVTGVTRASGMIRGTAGTQPVAILGVEPGELLNIVWDRDGVNSTETLNLLGRVEELRGLPIPDRASWVSVNVKPVRSMPDVGVIVKIADSTGRLHNLTLGTLQPRVLVGGKDKFQCADPVPEDDLPPRPGWCEIGVSLAQLRDSLPTDESLTLEFLGFSRRPIEQGEPPRAGSMLIDRISAHYEDSADVMLKFGESDELNTVGGGYGEHGARIDDAGESGAFVSWAAPAFGTYRGVDLASPGGAHTVIGSEWIREQGFEVGDLMETTVGDRDVRVRIGGFTDHFPTLNPVVGPFMIASRATVWRALALDSDSIGAPMNEIWFSATGAGDDIATDDIQSLLQANGINAGSVRRMVNGESTEVPGLESTAWRFILGFGYTVLTAVGIVGVIIHTVGGFSLRRVEFSVLRSLGLTRFQLTAMILFESLTVIVFAALIGVLTGRTIALATIPYLTGKDPASITPPMLLWTDWKILSLTLAVFTGAVLVNLGFIAIMATTRSVHAEIRMGSR